MVSMIEQSQKVTTLIHVPCVEFPAFCNHIKNIMQLELQYKKQNIHEVLNVLVHLYALGDMSCLFFKLLTKSIYKLV